MNAQISASSSRKMNHYTIKSFLRYNLAGLIFIGLFLCAGVILYTFWDLPSISSLPEKYMTPSVRITDRNGRLLYEVLPETGGRNTVLAIENIPQCLKDANTAAAKKKFYYKPEI